MHADLPIADPLPSFDVDLNQCSVSGLSSGAFMSVQLHLAHSSMFAGAGIVAGGPWCCAGSYPGPAPLAGDARVQNALFVCMNPLIPGAGPDAAALARQAIDAASHGLIDPVEHLSQDRLYIFTGLADSVVASSTVRATRDFYRALGVPQGNLCFVDHVDAGHALLTTNLEDNPLDANQPPYLNRAPGARPQSHDILEHIHGPLKPAVDRPAGRLMRFDQREFFDHETRASMSAYGYVYVPPGVLKGRPARVHVVLHGCKQGANYVDFVDGRPDRGNNPPYGLRYVTTTGYNEMADANDLIVLYPQAEGIDDGRTQNPEGCWDWWGYSCVDPDRPDFHTRDAIQIRALHGMLQRLGGH